MGLLPSPISARSLFAATGGPYGLFISVGLRLKMKD
jgi:hypothetical protein